MGLTGSVPNGAASQQKYLKLGEKCASKYADELIVLSNNNQKYFKETYGRDTHLIPNGIVKKNADYSAREISERFGLQKRRLYFVF